MLNGHGPAPKVVVVGGSLGGLFDAIALRSLGYEVDVHEKSSGLMQDRGAGIVFQPEVAAFLHRYSVAPLESVVVPVRTRRYLQADGSIAQEGPMPQAMTSWDALYRKLRAASGEDCYHVGVRLTGFESNSDAVTARFDSGNEEECDLLVGADGPGSTVRGHLLPEVRSEYAGYVAWRGVVLEYDAPFRYFLQSRWDLPLPIRHMAWRIEVVSTESMQSSSATTICHGSSRCLRRCIES